jgi:hypothetical protein
VARILVINDYSLQRSWDHAKAGRSPAHFLYGVDHLAAAGFDIHLVSEQWSRTLATVDRHLRRFGRLFGSLDRQLAAWPQLRDVDAIYAPCQSQIQGLTYLSAIGVVKIPIICLAHHPIVRGRLGAATRSLARLMIRGLAAMPALSRQVAMEINNLVPERPKSIALQWGPDAAFYPPSAYPGTGILAAGRTGRDFAVFGRAATAARVPATIVCFATDVEPAFASFGDNVRVMAQSQFLEYSETARMFAGARALAIPMVAQEGLCGLTSLMDALAAGKPVIMTRNPLIDLDIESLGIGRWVDPGDENGWIQALRFFEDQPDVAAEMGQRALGLVRAGLDYRSFSQRVIRIVRDSR